MHNVQLTMYNFGKAYYTTPTASPCGFGTSPFKSYGLKGGGKDGGKGQVPSFSLGAHFLPEGYKGGAGNPARDCLRGFNSMHNVQLTMYNFGKAYYTTPTASPCGFGTSPFECSALKGGGKDGGKGRSPFLFSWRPLFTRRVQRGSWQSRKGLPEGVQFNAQCTINNVQFW